MQCYEIRKYKSSIIFENIKTKNALVAVPELSVALMGLLGLGMLIKRRRA